MTTTALTTTPPLGRSLPAWLPVVQGIAITTMAVDHVSLWLVSGDIPALLRVTMGRLALPMFCFMVAWHALHSTNARRYADRILFIALAAQLPFLVLRGEVLGNICFTLAAAAYLAAYHRHRDPVALVAGVLLAGFTWLNEYGPLALGLVLAFMAAIRWPLAWLVPLLAWPVLQYGPSLSAVSAFLGVALLLALVTTRLPPLRLPRPLTRWFYPAHLWLIYLLRGLA
ncbi:conjugal transfer protein TraX [Halomonas organivorans]